MQVLVAPQELQALLTRERSPGQGETDDEPEQSPDGALAAGGSWENERGDETEVRPGDGRSAGRHLPPGTPRARHRHRHREQRLCSA
jgi:hypothetical protein